jgi:hypothetical protein
MMDYGSLLWKMDFDVFEQKCKESQGFMALSPIS